ncbi:replication endonuclease [Roseibium sp. SCP15]|uniref:replication endonuclease n=1 Tax=Roseibium sp. SCP15 TaxID=3141376 RepID=UPI003A97DA98
MSIARAFSMGGVPSQFDWCTPPSRQQLLDNLSHLGTREARERAWNEVNFPEDIRGKHLADRLNEFVRLANPSPKSNEVLLHEDLEALDIEHRDVRSRIPAALGAYLDKMHPARRLEREEAIRSYVGLKDLSLISMTPLMLATAASGQAWQYAKKFPGRDENGTPTHQERVHKKRRCEKWWRRHLRKRQRRALLYIESAVGAVGGPNVPGRPLYVSDYALESYKSQLRTTAEILEDLRLVCVEDPSIQIPMKDLNERKKAADAAKRRLLMDAILARIEGLGWHMCWITITLPGEYVPHSTNESHRASEWNPELGPDEAMREIQNRYHQTMCFLRERGIRPIGFWNAQAQQSGTPHRHILLACPTLEDARAVCDAFWGKFSSITNSERQAEARKKDPGCRAYVVGDDHPHYTPPKGRDGREETASSIAKYMSRYATRFVNPDCDAEEDTDLLRHAAWASARRARTHSWIGMDAGRSPSALWDTLWSKAARSDGKTDPEQPRMRLAIRMMREVQECIDTIGKLRRHQDTLEGEDHVHQRDLIKAESSKAAHRAWHAGIALGLWPDRDLAPEELEWLKEETTAFAPDHTNDEYAGRIHHLERHGIRRTARSLDVELPPMPLRDIRESVYGERRAVTIGAVAPIPRCVLTVDQFRNATSLKCMAELLGIGLEDVPSGQEGNAAAMRKTFRRSGIQLLKRPDGSIAGFDLTGEQVLRTEKEWIIADFGTAQEMFEEWEDRLKKQRRLDHLSDNPTDPRKCPKDIFGSDQSGNQSPP